MNDVLVLSGSVFGGATGIAELIHKDLQAASIPSRCMPMNEYRDKNGDLTKEKYVIVVCSTTGDGEPPENAARFWRVLKNRDLPSSHLAGVTTAVLGLGDTNYTNFCQMGKNFATRFNELGAAKLIEPVFADDAQGTDNFVEPFRTRVVAALQARFTSPASPATDTAVAVAVAVADIDPTANPMAPDATAAAADATASTALTLPKVPAAFLVAAPAPAQAVRAAVLVPAQVASGVTDCTVVRYRCLSAPAAVKRSLELELAFPSLAAAQAYVPGDAFQLFCPNARDEVELVLRRTDLAGLDPDTPLLLQVDPSQAASKKAPTVPPHFPSGEARTLRELLTHVCDIRGPAPKKTLLCLLASCATDSKEADNLNLLASRQGTAKYAELCQQRVGLVDLLAQNPSCRPPLLRVLELLPSLSPRLYSACSTPLVDTVLPSGETFKTVSFVFNIVDNSMPHGQPPRAGLCTTWLDSLCRSLGSAPQAQWVASPGASLLDLRVPIKLRPSLGFSLPADPTVPLVLVGPGTGVAPMVGFLRHRHVLKQRGGDSGPIWLFFGCRNRALDFLFQEELEAFKKEGLLTELLVAASRDHDSELKYVQHCMQANAAALTKLFAKENAALYVCGNAQSMAADVDKALLHMFEHAGGMATEEATAFKTALKDGGRYHREVYM